MAVRSTEEIKDIVKEYCRALVAAGILLDKAILFGSDANSKQREYSDIDVALFLNKYKNDRFETWLELMKLTRKFDIILEPHPFLSSDFE
jgi:predicted nucleotidyltransferase